jgi:hypothetical protein
MIEPLNLPASVGLTYGVSADLVIMAGKIKLAPQTQAVPNKVVSMRRPARIVFGRVSGRSRQKRPHGTLLGPEQRGLQQQSGDAA